MIWIVYVVGNSLDDLEHVCNEIVVDQYCPSLSTYPIGVLMSNCLLKSSMRSLCIRDISYKISRRVLCNPALSSTLSCINSSNLGKTPSLFIISNVISFWRPSKRRKAMIMCKVSGESSYVCVSDILWALSCRLEILRTCRTLQTICCRT